MLTTHPQMDGDHEMNPILPSLLPFPCDEIAVLCSSNRTTCDEAGGFGRTQQELDTKRAASAARAKAFRAAAAKAAALAVPYTVSRNPIAHHCCKIIDHNDDVNPVPTTSTSIIIWHEALDQRNASSPTAMTPILHHRFCDVTPVANGAAQAATRPTRRTLTRLLSCFAASRAAAAD